MAREENTKLRRFSRPVRSMNAIETFMGLSSLVFLFGALFGLGMLLAGRNLDADERLMYWILLGVTLVFSGTCAGSRALLTHDRRSGIVLAWIMTPLVVATVLGGLMFAAVLEHFLNRDVYGYLRYKAARRPHSKAPKNPPQMVGF